MLSLTATTPIMDKVTFFHPVNCILKKATIFRSPTTRPNISYSVLALDVRDGDNKRASTTRVVRMLIDQEFARYAKATLLDKGSNPGTCREPRLRLVMQSILSSGLLDDSS